VVINERISNRTKCFRIGNRVDLDHMSLELTMEVRLREGHGKRKDKEERKGRK